MQNNIEIRYVCLASKISLMISWTCFNHSLIIATDASNSRSLQRILVPHIRLATVRNDIGV